MEFQLLGFSAGFRLIPRKRIFIFCFQFPFCLSDLKLIYLGNGKMDQTPVAFPDHNWFSREIRYQEPPGRFMLQTVRDKGKK